jgi:hypothetical protein
MATSDHPIVLDLGSVIGPAGQTGPAGPRGPAGIAYTSGEPSSGEGSDGELRIDPATGIVYVKNSGTWTVLCTLMLGTSTPTNIDIGGTGTSPGLQRVRSFGGIGYFSLSGDNQDPVEWSKTVNVAVNKSDATNIVQLPSELRPTESMIAYGRLYTESHTYRAEFILFGTSTEGFEGKLQCRALWDMTDGSLVEASSVVVTAFDVKFFYRLA